MSEFRNDVTNKKGHSIWGICITFVWEIKFEQLYLSQERRYQVLTYRFKQTKAYVHTQNLFYCQLI